MPTLKGTRIRAGIRSVLAPSGDYQGGAAVDQFVDLAVGSGTAANQADVLWSDLRTLTTTAEDLDLQTLTDANGTALALAEVMAIMIEVGASNSSNLVLEPGASNGWAAMFGTAGLILRPGSTFLVACPTNPAWAVGASTKVLNVENLGTGSYRITILGRSA